MVWVWVWRASIEQFAGDINADCLVDVQDLRLFNEAYGATSGDTNWSMLADLDNDRVVAARAHYRLMGDVNADYLVNVDDLRLLSEAYGTVTDSTYWNAPADLNVYERVDVWDLSMLAMNYG